MQQPKKQEFQKSLNNGKQQEINSDIQSLNINSKDHSNKQISDQKLSQTPNQSVQKISNKNSIHSYNKNYPHNQSINFQQSNMIFHKKIRQSNLIDQNKTQFFPINYDGSTFFVDPIILSRSSTRFRELISPYIQNCEQMKSLHLEIQGNQFTKRNMSNFLCLCQNLPANVQNSEMKEICEIAQIFKASQVFDKMFSFAKSKVDPNFFVPENKFNSDDVMSIQSDSEVSDSYFEDFDNSSYQGTYVNITSQKQQDDQNKKNEKNQEKVKLDDDENQLELRIKNRNESESKESKNEKSSTIYLVNIEHFKFKCPLYKFSHEKKNLYTAKIKFNKIYIAEGSDVRISKKKEHVASIVQHKSKQSNSITIGDVSFDLNYVNTGLPHIFSIDVTFPYHNKSLTWSPLKKDSAKNNYYQCLQGEYNHSSMESYDNLVLQNLAGHPTFIVRKMYKDAYEIECNKQLDPLVAFSIGLSQIIGPYVSPFADADDADDSVYLKETTAFG